MSNSVKKIKFALFILLMVVGVLVVYKNWSFISNLEVEAIAGAIKENEHITGIVYLGIYLIKPLLLIIPTNMLALVSGGLFGPIKGFILTMIGFWIAGTIAFYLARLLGRDFVEGILKSKFGKFENIMQKSGFKYLFILRLPPIIPYDPLSYASGLTNISYKDFILASLIGVIPETMCYSIIGTSFRNPFSLQFIIPIIILIIGTISAKYIIGSGKKA